MVKKKGKSTLDKIESAPKVVKPGDFLKDGEIVFDEAEHFNGLSDEDLSAKTGPFSFTCKRREYCITKDGYHYFVTPDAEYEELDFEGHVVLINGRPRMCHSFEVDEDGHIVIFVASISEARNASSQS